MTALRLRSLLKRIWRETKPIVYRSSEKTLFFLIFFWHLTQFVSEWKYSVLKKNVLLLSIFHIQFGSYLCLWKWLIKKQSPNWCLKKRSLVKWMSREKNGFIDIWLWNLIIKPFSIECCGWILQLKRWIDLYLNRIPIWIFFFWIFTLSFIQHKT